MKQDKNMEYIVSLILQIGVLLSALIIILGIIVFFNQHGQYAYPLSSPSYHLYSSSRFYYPHNFKDLYRSVANGRGTGIIVLGVLLLILTPIIRVAASVVLFLRSKDRPMALITFIVLTILGASFYLGAIGH